MYCDTWRSLGCETTPLKYRSKRKPLVESRMTKQQTRLSLTSLVSEFREKKSNLIFIFFFFGGGGGEGVEKRGRGAGGGEGKERVLEVEEVTMTSYHRMTICIL